MRRIYKYYLELTVQSVDVHGSDAIVRHVGMQNDRLTMWVECETTKPMVSRKFIVFGTGHDIDGNSWKWCGTTQDGPLVWHVYSDYGFVD